MTTIAQGGTIVIVAGVEAYSAPVPAGVASVIQVAVRLAEPGATVPVTVGVQASADEVQWVAVPVTLTLDAARREASHIARCGYAHYRLGAMSAEPVMVVYDIVMSTAYADLADIAALSLPDHALRDVSEASKLRALLAASDELDGYLHAHYQLPLTSWGHDLRMHCAGLAAAVLMRARGYSPEAGSDELIRMMRTDALEWADRVATGKLSPPALVDSTPDVLDAGAIVKGRGPRGW